MRLSLLFFAAPVRRFLSISTCSTVEQLKKLRHIIFLNGVATGGPLWQLRVWMVSTGFLEAVKEEDVFWWAGLWVETLAQAAYYSKEPQLQDFDWKDGFVFVKHDEKTEGGNREKR